jgi:hypothetical protein
MLLVLASLARWASTAQHQITEGGKALGGIVAAALLLIGLVTCTGIASAQAPPDETHAYVSPFGVEVEFQTCLSSDALNCYADFSIYRNPQPGFTQNPIWAGTVGDANSTSHTITDTQVKVGQSYTYQVCGGGLANSGRSNCRTTNTVTLSAPPPPTPTPTPKPTQNSSNANSCFDQWAPPQKMSALGGLPQIHLKWTNPIQHQCPQLLTHIEVYRMGSTVIYQRLAELDKATNNGILPDRYTDTGPLQPHTAYYYQVCEGDANRTQSNCSFPHANTGGADPILMATRVNATMVKLQISVDQEMGISSLLVTREGSDDPCRQGVTLGNGSQGCRTATTGPNGVKTNAARIATVYDWTNGSTGGPTFSSKSAPYIINIPNDTGVAAGVEYYYKAHVVWGSGGQDFWGQDSTVVTVPSFYALAPAQGALPSGPKPIKRNGTPPPSQPAPAMAPAVTSTAPMSPPASPLKGGTSPTVVPPPSRSPAAASPASTPAVKSTSPAITPASATKGPATPTPTPSPSRPNNGG